MSLLTASSGCVERRLTVRSEPTGATVILSGRVLDRPTPVSVRLDHHGSYRVEVEKAPTDPEGVAYRRVVRTVTTEEPWYEMFPIDLVAEVLWPGTLTSEAEILVRLVPIPTGGPPITELDRLLEEADASRAGVSEDG